MHTTPKAHETRIRELALELGPLAAFQCLIAENNARFLGPELDNACEAMIERTAIYMTIIGDWARARHAESGHQRPFALVALGGTGRWEMTPRSDIDVALLFRDKLEGNEFLIELQKQTIDDDGEAFCKAHGFRIQPLPFSLEEAAGITGENLNSFLDLHPIYDPDNLAPAFRSRLRVTCDPFEHFLYVRTFWKRQLADAPACESVNNLDLKHDVLRIFQAAVWTLAGHGFQHSHEVYRDSVDDRDLAAYFFVLGIRAWLHLRRSHAAGKAGPGRHPEDVLTYEDFTSFGEMLGPSASEDERFEFSNAVRARFLSARRRLVAFARGVIAQELKEGRHVAPEDPILLGPAGLRYVAAHPPRTAHAKSRAALRLLLTAQHYDLEIDPSELHATFRNAGDWLVPVPELRDLFFESRGSLADSFAFLSQIDGAEDRLFPGYARFESSIDGRVMSERRSLRGALEKQKMRDFERFITEGTTRLSRSPNPQAIIASGEGRGPAIQSTFLDPDHRAAIKLALKTKRLPVTPNDLAARADQSRPLHERHSSGFSGLPLSTYFARYESECSFPPRVLGIAEFLVANRRAFKELAEGGFSSKERVEAFARACGSAERLRALYIFTCADRAQWESASMEPTRWWLIRELYQKAADVFHPPVDPIIPLANAGYEPADLAILRDVGEDLFSGAYRMHAIHFGSHLVSLADKECGVGPKVEFIRDGTSVLLGVAARDFRGLAACISGELWRCDIEFEHAHFFCAMNQGLALDFFHLSLAGPSLPESLPTRVANAIQAKHHITDADEASLPKISGSFTLSESHAGLRCLRFETTEKTPGLIYALTYKVFRHLGGNIHALKSASARGRTDISIHYTAPKDRTLDEERRIVQQRFIGTESAVPQAAIHNCA